MADAVEPVRQDMDQEAADELGHGPPHHILALSILDTIVLLSALTMRLFEMATRCM